MGRLENRIAIVTGGSRGMGRCYCERFAEEGASVALIYRARSDAADEERSGRARAFQAIVVSMEGECGVGCTGKNCKLQVAVDVRRR